MLNFNQKNKKSKASHIQMVRDYVNFSASEHYNEHKAQLIQLQNAYLGLVDEKEQIAISSTTKPYGYSYGLEYMIYPLIESKIERIVSIYMKRPLLDKAYVKDKKSIHKKLSAKVDMLMEEMYREKHEALKEQGLEIETDNPQIDLPEDVEEDFTKNYKTISEEITNAILHIFLKVRKNQQLIPELLRNYLIFEECRVVCDQKQGHPHWRSDHPIDVVSDINGYSKVQRDHDYYVTNVYMSYNEIINKFNLTKSEKNSLKALFDGIENPRIDNKTLFGGVDDKGWLVTEDNINKIAVVCMNWKSEENINLRFFKNQKGEEGFAKMGKKDRERKNDRIETIEKFEPRHCYMIGPQLCLSWGVTEERLSYIEEPLNCELNPTSLIGNTGYGNRKIRSVASKLIKLQKYASDILFEIRIAMKRNNGRVLLYDTSQIPKVFTKGKESAINRVMHHAKKDQFLFINSQDRNVRNGFNQFTSLDLSTRNLINDLIGGLAMVEDLADKFIGLSPEVQGNASKYSAATTTERNAMAGITRLETYFQPFDNFIQAALEKMILVAKQIYEKNEVIHYIKGEFEQKFITIMSDFFDEDIGIYLGDSAKNQEAKEIINRAAELALGNPQTPDMLLDLVRILNKDNATEAEAILERSFQALNKIREENQKAMQEIENNKLQQQAQKDAEDAQLKREGFDNNIDVAEIYVRGKDNENRTKVDSQERMKLADIEKEMLMNNRETSKNQ